MMLALRSKISSHPEQFTLVDTKDSELSLIVTADCIPQKPKTDPFTCFYTSEYAGGATKTFMGGGISVLHYTSMAAMRMSAVCSYSPTVVILSVLVSMASASIGFGRTSQRKLVAFCL